MRTFLLIIILLPPVANADLGQLVNPGKDLDFVDDTSSRVIVHSPLTETYEIRTLRGEPVRTLVRTSYPLADVSANAERLLLSTPTGLMAVRVGGDIRELAIERTRSQLGYVYALSASGAHIAETRSGERRIRIWSFDTLERTHDLPCPDHDCVLVAWDAKNENVLWVAGYSHDEFDRLDLTTGKTERMSPINMVLPIRIPASHQIYQLDRCRMTGVRLNPHDEGLELWAVGRPTRRLVEVRGRTRGFHDMANTIPRAGFIGKCRYVFFEFRRRNYLVDVQGGRIGPFMDHLVYVMPDGYGVP
jgi:hypothetical protein